MSRWSQLLTEQANPASRRIDELPTLQMLRLINREDRRVAPAVAAPLPAIAAAVDLVAARLAQGGRLFYLGAGTSGRLGILDASECPPTFSAPPEMIQGLIAGGPAATFRAVEGAEDDPEAAVQDLRERRLGPGDVAMGIAASGVTPYVHGGLEYARGLGAGTIFFTCSPTAVELVEADVKIVAEVGPEVITGSTRMKAGTATKLVLNMISTGAMVRLGKTYGNLMVDLQPTNAKLKDRSRRILQALTGRDEATAARTLSAAGGRLKLALVMELCGVDVALAERLLADNGGLVKKVLAATHDRRRDGDPLPGTH
jgi:N-acetylmuramic acid 6-phosphate etherase